MKEKIKRLFASIAAILMAIGLIGANAVPVFAAAGDVSVSPASGQTLTNVTTETTTTDKVITIKTPTDTDENVGNGTAQQFTYHIYKIFDATGSGSGSDRTVAYTNSNANLTLPIYDGENESSSLHAFAVDGSNVAYYNKTTNGAWEKDTSPDGQLPASMIQKLGTLTSSFTDIGTVTVTGTGQTARVQVAGYGYYYVTSTTGSVVAINTLNPSAEIGDKNTVPYVDKTITSVSDNTTGSVATDKKSATAKIGDTITYSVVVHAKAGTEGLEFHDTLGDGLTLTGEAPTSITDTTAASAGHTAVNFTKENSISGAGTLGQYAIVKYAATASTVTDSNNGEDISIKFGGTFVTDTDITIVYSATLNSNAVIAGNGNPNSATIKYGHDSGITSKPSTTTTYTYDFDLVKTGAGDTDDGKKVLTGAEFQLFKGTAGTGDSVTKTGDAISFVKVNKTGSEEYDTYRIAVTGDTNTVTTIPAGYVRFVGLGNGTYALEETKAPEGYNKLTEPVKVTINNANDEATVTGTKAANTLAWASGNYRVQNNKGSLLPSTGGIGTTIFYIAGGILIIGAAVLLIARRKRNA